MVLLVIFYFNHLNQIVLLSYRRNWDL